MPTLDDLLAQTMMFTAAKGLNTTPVEFSGAFAVPQPSPRTEDLTEQEIRDNAVWQWKAEPAAVGVWREATCLSRGMGMNYSMPVPVLDILRWADVEVVRRSGQVVGLPLDPSFVIGTWRITSGRIREGRSPWWPIDARVDASMLVALAYQLDDDEPRPLSRVECDELGDDLMPSVGRIPRLSFPADGKTKGFVCVGPTRYVLALELVLCKEHDDFAPGGMVGMCRVHPHALFWSNEELQSFEAKLELHRPPKAMTHGDPSMQPEIEAMVVTDCNAPTSPVPGPFPLPIADVIYDYYEVHPRRTFEARKLDKERDHPRQLAGEVCMADPRFSRARAIDGEIVRNRGTHRWKDTPLKTARQGQFDNLHLAPLMRLSFDATVDTHEGKRKIPISFKHIAMMFVCIHDCLHMHVRWGEHADEPMTRGWWGGRPHAKAGAPTVPENQAVFVKLLKDHVAQYRAVAENVKPGALQILCHHGLGYAIDEWPSAGAAAIRGLVYTGVMTVAELQHEPFMLDMPPVMLSWPAFYWRFRFGGTLEGAPVERLSFNLEKCMR